MPQESTSDRAELYAVAAAIALFPHAAHIFIYTDSAYMITMQQHFEAILASGGDSHLNGDLLWFIAKQCLISKKTILFNKVRAHTGIELNELADQAAKSGRITLPEPAECAALHEAIVREPRDPIHLPARDDTPDEQEIASTVMKLTNDNRLQDTTVSKLRPSSKEPPCSKTRSQRAK